MTTTAKRLALTGLLLLVSLGFNSTATATHYNHGKYGNFWYHQDLRPIARPDFYRGVVGEAINENVKLNDFEGDAPAKVQLFRGQLPLGLKLHRNGDLVGTPTQAGRYFVKYKLRDRNRDRDYSWVLIVIAEPNLIPIAEDDDFSVELGAEFRKNVIDNNDFSGDGEASAELTSGTLPPGLSLNPDGSITGIATSSGRFSAVYTITDANGDTSSATIVITITEAITYCPQPALSDELHGGSHSHAVWISEISTNLQFIGTPSVDRELPNGDMSISGTIVDGDIQFDVVMNYSGYTPTSDSPKLELLSSSYIENGGPIDPSTWEYFSDLSATFTGTSGEWDGVVLNASLRGPMAQLGIGANGKNGNFGLANWFDLSIRSYNETLPDGFYVGQILTGDVNIDLPDECPRKLVKTQCSVAAAPDAYAKSEITHSILISNIPDRELLFEPGALVEVFDNGDVTVSGTVVGTYSGAMLDVVLEYSNATNESATSPRRDLTRSAYIENGGPIDTDTWTYFDSFSATFTGVPGDATFDGVVFEAVMKGEVPQMGVGANGKNINFGLSNWFDVTVTQAPETGSRFKVGDTFTGDVNIDLNDECPRPVVRTQCSVAAAPDAYAKSEITHSILISNIPDRELLFEPAALVEVLDNDDMIVTGTVIGTYSGAMLDVVLEYSDATDVSGTPPRRDLIRSAYSENGGPVDTDTWTYFNSFTATFTGVPGDATFDGVVFQAVIKGEIPQMGVGANGKNINFGLSNWFDVTVIEAPETGSRFSIGDTFTGDVNIDISEPEGCGFTSDNGDGLE